MQWRKVRVLEVRENHVQRLRTRQERNPNDRNERSPSLEAVHRCEL
jgi:hypothetical protein